jgi:hypothetical protein
MSIQRTYAQRNNTNTNLSPEFSYALGPLGPGLQFDLSGSSLYTLNIEDVPANGSIYYVDVGGKDSNGHPLHVNGNLYSLTGLFGGPNTAFINNINFAIHTHFDPSYYPGLEFTIFFKNIPYQRLSNRFLSIGIASESEEPILPFIVSPPYPSLPVIGGLVQNQSVTFKSDGKQMNVVASGPAGWLGLPALAAILTFYTMLILG